MKKIFLIISIVLFSSCLRNSVQILTDGEYPYKIIEISPDFGDNTKCIYKLESLHPAKFYYDVRLKTSCNSYVVGDMLYFTPIIINK